jgi:hypothetical protein
MGTLGGFPNPRPLPPPPPRSLRSASRALTAGLATARPWAKPASANAIQAGRKPQRHSGHRARKEGVRIQSPSPFCYSDRIFTTETRRARRPEGKGGSGSMIQPLHPSPSLCALCLCGEVWGPRERGPAPRAEPPLFQALLSATFGPCVRRALCEESFHPRHSPT